ncbi:MAG: hypothetical protein HY905_17825 [Deltaproteobacteria bacterium]|nr:hypothetical protein [Deltaproteobacteria bacterium]
MDFDRTDNVPLVSSLHVAQEADVGARRRRDAIRDVADGLIGQSFGCVAEYEEPLERCDAGFIPLVTERG